MSEKITKEELIDLIKDTVDDKFKSAEKQLPETLNKLKEEQNKANVKDFADGLREVLNTYKSQAEIEKQKEADKKAREEKVVNILGDLLNVDNDKQEIKVVNKETENKETNDEDHYEYNNDR